MLFTKVATLTLTVLLLTCNMFIPPSFAQPEEEENTSQTPVVKQAPEKENLFAKTVKEEEKAWLTVNGRRLLALYLSEASGRAHGGVLIIPESGRYPTQGIINSLRHTLSDHHWHTLAMDMTPHTNANGSINEVNAQKTIKAGIQYLNEQGVYNIAVLGEGIGATLALQYVATLAETNSATSKFQQIRALIMVNAQNAIPHSDTDALKAFKTVTLPILDAYSGENVHNQKLAKQRKKAGRRQMSRYHQQIRLPPMALFQHTYENRTTKQIRGWLDKNVAGFMVQENR